MEWRTVVSDLYNKIKPLSGTLSHFMTNKVEPIAFIEIISVSFDLENFTYVDPFYGEMEANNNFQMYFEIHGEGNKDRLKTIKDIEHRTFSLGNNERIGCFSNSIDFVVPYCKFGKIENQHIPFEMEYILTNSDSYGMMTGSFEDHATLRGKIKTILKVNGLRFRLINDQPIEPYLTCFDQNVYAPEKAEIAKGHTSHVYEIPLKG